MTLDKAAGYFREYSFTQESNGKQAYKTAIASLQHWERLLADVEALRHKRVLCSEQAYENRAYDRVLNLIVEHIREIEDDD